MTLPPSERDSPTLANPDATPDPVIQFYGVKFEILMKSDSKTVEAKSFLFHITKTLQKSKNDNEELTILDVYNNEVPTDLEGITVDDIPNKFKFIVTGKESEIAMFGLNLRTNIPFAKLKERSLEFFQENSIFMKPHNIGFDLGVHWFNLGYLMDTHPTYGDHSALIESIRKVFQKGWDLNHAYWTTERKEKINAAFKKHYGYEYHAEKFPITIQPNNITARQQGKDTIRTLAATVMCPFALIDTGKAIMDYIFLEKKALKNYIPTSFQNEDSQEYYELALDHQQWMYLHRNIQVTNVSSLFEYQSLTPSNTSDMTLQKLLNSIPWIYGTKFDPIRNRINVSVSIDKFASTIEWIERELDTHKFPCNPQVKKPLPPQPKERPPKTSSPNSSIASKSTYAEALAHHKTARHTLTTDSTDKGTSRNQRPTTTSNRRTRQPPVPKTINFTDVNDFPFLKKTEKEKSADAKPTTTSPTTTTTTTSKGTTANDTDANTKADTNPTVVSTASDSLTASTFDKTISDLKSTITKMDDAHKQEIIALRTELQTALQKPSEAHKEEIASLRLELKTALEKPTAPSSDQKALQSLTAVIVDIQKQQAAITKKLASQQNGFETQLEKIFKLLSGQGHPQPTKKTQRPRTIDHDHAADGELPFITVSSKRHANRTKFSTPPKNQSTRATPPTLPTKLFSDEDDNYFDALRSQVYEDDEEMADEYMEDEYQEEIDLDCSHMSYTNEEYLHDDINTDEAEQGSYHEPETSPTDHNHKVSTQSTTKKTNPPVAKALVQTSLLREINKSKAAPSTKLVPLNKPTRSTSSQRSQSEERGSD